MDHIEELRILAKDGGHLTKADRALLSSVADELEKLTELVNCINSKAGGVDRNMPFTSMHINCTLQARGSIWR